MYALRYSFLFAALLCGCAQDAKRPSTASAPSLISDAYAGPPPSAPSTPSTHGAAAPAAVPAGATQAAPSAPALDPSRGHEVGLVYEAYLSPHQEPDEEENTPSTTPKQFRSTTPSLSRAAREAAGHRAHGQVRFSKDFSRAWVDVRIEGALPATINMFHNRAAVGRAS